MPEIIYTQCIYPSCGATLGNESRELGFRLCHEHRKCSVCKEDLSPREIIYAHDAALEDSDPSWEDKLRTLPANIIHPRCSTLLRKDANQDPSVTIKQSYLDYLNNIRLMVIPNMDINESSNENTAMLFSTRLVSEMSFEQKYMHLRMMQACVAQTAILLKKDGKDIKQKLDALDKQRIKASREAAEPQVKKQYKERPPQVIKEEKEEQGIQAFMTQYGLTDKTEALKIKRNITKAVYALMTAAGLSEQDATQSAIKPFIDKGLLKPPQETQIH